MTNVSARNNVLMLVPSRGRLREWWEADEDDSSVKNVGFWTNRRLDAVFEIVHEGAWVAAGFVLIALFGADLFFSGAAVLLFGILGLTVGLVVVVVGFLVRLRRARHGRRPGP